MEISSSKIPTLMEIIQRRYKIILAGVFTLLVLIAGTLSLIPDKFKAESSVQFKPRWFKDVTSNDYLLERMMDNLDFYKSILKNSAVQSAVGAGRMPPNELKEKLKISFDKKKQLFKVEMTGKDVKELSPLVQATADSIVLSYPSLFDEVTGKLLEDKLLQRKNLELIIESTNDINNDDNDNSTEKQKAELEKIIALQKIELAENFLNQKLQLLQEDLVRVEMELIELGIQPEKVGSEEAVAQSLVSIPQKRLWRRLALYRQEISKVKQQLRDNRAEYYRFNKAKSDIPHDYKQAFLEEYFNKVDYVEKIIFHIQVARKFGFEFGPVEETKISVVAKERLKTGFVFFLLGIMILFFMIYFWEIFSAKQSNGEGGPSLK